MARLLTHAQCIELLDEHNVPENVRKHSIAVNKAAVFLAKKLKEKGIKIDVELVDRASLLHDIDKIPTLGKGTHGKVAREILEGKGYPELARAVHNHIYNAIFDELTWEDKVINYADKRCQEDEIHPLKSRLEYIRNKYGRKNAEINDKAEPLFYKLEKEIFDVIGTEPDSLGEQIEAG